MAEIFHMHYTHMHACTHAYTHACTHAPTHTHTHTVTSTIVNFDGWDFSCVLHRNKRTKTVQSHAQFRVRNFFLCSKVWQKGRNIYLSYRAFNNCARQYGTPGDPPPPPPSRDTKILPDHPPLIVINARNLMTPLFMRNAVNFEVPTTQSE